MNRFRAFNERLSGEAPIFFPRKDRLDPDQAAYYQDLLYRVTKVGTEIEFALPKGVRREDFQPLVEQIMYPSQDMNQLGSLGVYDVVKEHSGVEIQVIGRHPHFETLQTQYRSILAPLISAQVRMRPTCGLHFHALCIGIAESLPEIIVANLWNLTRKYAPGLKFLTSAGKNREGLTRRRQHNAHREFMRLSPLHYSMRDIQKILKGSHEVPEHQNFLNLEHLRFDEYGSVKTLHLEFRFPDGDLCPTSIASKTYLFLIMLLKSVEISKFGLIHVGRIRQWRRKKMLMEKLSNNDGPVATSDTSGLTDDDIGEYRLNAKQLLKDLKSIFLLLDTPAEIVLQSLAQRPLSLRRSDGADWRSMEHELNALVSPAKILDELDLEIIKIVELGLLENAEDQSIWMKSAANMLKIPRRLFEKRLFDMKKRVPTWNPELGRMVFGR